MRLFEFDISWDQPVTEAFDQDDVKVIGTQRVETDSVRIVAPDREIADLVLHRAMTHRGLVVRVVREMALHFWASYEPRIITPVKATRCMSGVELNELGRFMKHRESA